MPGVTLGVGGTENGEKKVHVPGLLHGRGGRRAAISPLNACARVERVLPWWSSMRKDTGTPPVSRDVPFIGLEDCHVSSHHSPLRRGDRVRRRSDVRQRRRGSSTSHQATEPPARLFREG